MKNEYGKNYYPNCNIATKEGRTFVGQYVIKGQTVKGHTFKSDGKYCSEGIDLVYSDKNFVEGNENIGAETTGGTKGGRLKLGVSINTTAEKTSLIDKVTTVTHKPFLHVQKYSFD